MSELDLEVFGHRVLGVFLDKLAPTSEISSSLDILIKGPNTIFDSLEVLNLLLVAEHELKKLGLPGEEIFDIFHSSDEEMTFRELLYRMFISKRQNEN